MIVSVAMLATRATNLRWWEAISQSIAIYVCHCVHVKQEV